MIRYITFRSKKYINVDTLINSYVQAPVFSLWKFIISAKWTKWNWQIYCFHFCLCLSVCVCVCAHSFEWMGRMTHCLPRNVFDSCAKSWQYFRTDKILLEMSFYCLSDDTVRFKIKVGFYEKCKKCNTYIMQNGFTAAHRAAMTSWHRPVHSLFIVGMLTVNRLTG